MSKAIEKDITTVLSASNVETSLTRAQPSNVLAEQMLLGTILTNNDALNRVQDFLRSEHFFEPVHQKMYEAIITLLDKGIVATPVTLKNYFDKDQSLKESGGGEYLAYLASLSTTIINMVDYGKTIVDLFIRRKLITLGQEVVNDAYEKDIASTAIEQIEKAEQDLFNLDSFGREGAGGFKPLKSSLLDAINKVQLAYKHQERVTGVSTGFLDLDRLLGGFQNSDLLIVAGRPSMGKTALAMNFALNACRSLYENHQKKLANTPDTPLEAPAVGFFSLEMSSEQLASRLLSMISAVNSGKLRSGQINESEFKDILVANKELYQLPFYIDDTPSLSIAALRTRARRLKRKHNLGLIIVDYLQLLRGSSRTSEESRVLEISEITQGLKAVAKELNVPVIALSQLSRAVEQREDKRPLLSDLRESGSIEQDADIVMFIYREEYYLVRKQPKEDTLEHAKWQSDMDKIMNISDVIIAKQRNGPIGSVKLHFDSNLTKFSNHTTIDKIDAE